MQSQFQPTKRARLASLLIAAGLTACGSSDPAPGQQGPGAEGELPLEFAVFIADGSAGGPQLLSGGLPFLYDFTTGETRAVGGGLPADQIIPNQAATLSPDGRWLYAVSGTFQDHTTHVIDLQNGTTRRIPLATGGSGLDGDDYGVPAFSICDDSSRVAIQAPGSSFLRRLFVCNPDGSGLQRVQIAGNDAHPVDWLGSSDRLLVTTFVEALDTEVFAIVNGDGSVSAPIQLSTAVDVSIDEISVAADGSAVAALIATFPQSGPETYEAAVVDLASGTVTRFGLNGADDGDVLMNDTGEYVAILTEHPVTGERELSIGEVATGAQEVATLPAAHSGGLSLDDDDLFWEPGGSRLAFISSHRDESAEELTIASFGAAPMPVEPTVVPDADVRDVAWSPSGRFLAYVDEPAGDVVMVFDAESVAPPQLVTDTTFSDSARDVTWTPDGEFLLAGERVATSGEQELLIYASSTFERVGSLGPAFSSNGQPDQPFQSGTSPFAFSRDGRHILWRSTNSGSQPNRLLSASLDDITSPAVHIAGLTPSGSPPDIFQFWLRR